jgi:pyrroline-5-carboxylate reductase
MRSAQYEIGIIGAGNAAEGIVHGLLRNSVLLDDRIIVSNHNPEKRKLFAERFKIAVTDDNRQVASNSYIVILAVKPQIYRDVVAEIRDLVTDEHVIVSIMAGVSTGTLEAQFAQIAARVVRVMPNLPMHVGAGMAGVFPGKHAREADLLRAQRIFEASGRTVVMESEALMDAVTAVSGSGPAYFYYFVEAITAAGQKAGLSAQHAALLAKQSCLGAARMMLESSDTPAVLRAKVTSPNGTTQAAMDSFAAEKVFEHIQEAVLAAYRRSQELGH